LLGYCEPNQYKLYEVYSGKTVFSRDIEFDERTPVAPLIEGETGNDLPDNAPLSLAFPKTPLPTSSGALLKSPASPSAPDEQEKAPPQRIEEIPPPANPTQQEAESTQDLGYSIYSRS
jgi:hypothetical protein